MTSITPINGSDFSIYDNGNYLSITGIASTYNGVIIYISINGGGVYKSSNNGINWVQISSTLYFTSIACSSNGAIVYGPTPGYGLFKSIDYGNTWNQVIFYPNDSLPGYPANPETTDITWTGPGYKLTNICQVTCDATGTKLIMSVNGGVSIYKSIDEGVSWTFIYSTPAYVTNGLTDTNVTSNSTGSILYAALNNSSVNKNIVVSNDSGVTWTGINLYGISGPFPKIVTNSYGDFVFGIDSFSRLSTFYPTHADYAVLTPGNGNTYSSLGVYNSGNNLIISQNYYPDTTRTISGGAVVEYTVTNKYAPGEPTFVCFKEGTKILTSRGYRRIEDLRKGDLIKTILNDYLPIEIIGKREIYHPALKENRIKDQLYKCSSNKYSEIFEDLVITGCHSILVDEFKDEQEREKTIEINGKIYETDDKYRLPACVDEKAVVYEKEGKYNIYHFSLENDNYYINYGIYANGLLVETCSKRYLKEISNMTLI